MLKVLVVGQTPPPYHGQAIMIDRLVGAHYERIEIEHLRMGFSADMDQVGKGSWYKVALLIALIWKTYAKRFTRRIECLYYPPAGPDILPVARDMAYLIACRWLFKYTVFHFHAGGVSELEPQLPAVLRVLFRLAYSRPDLAISLSGYNPPDGESFKAKRVMYIPYGIPDEVKETIERPLSDNVRLLFVGVLRESKGISDLIRALGILKSQDCEVHLDVLGSFHSREFELRLMDIIRSAKVEQFVSFHGVKTGEAKFDFYRKADIFCFPTFFESETFGVVILEAMQSSLPVVATRWRGVQSIVQDGETGYLVDINDPAALAIRIRRLIDNPVLRLSFGKHGREVFEQQYSIDTWHKAMEAAIDSLPQRGAA
jgi:glycosyltransferase involved in cell wall biosynthesis